jgi:hypothetical protein
MKDFFARLNPTERRFVVGVVVVFFLVINIVWVWPHFGDWSQTKGRMADATTRLQLFESGTNLIPALQKKIAEFQGHGQVVPPENQSVQFVREIQLEAGKCGFVPQSMTSGRGSGTNSQYFVEQTENMTLDTTEKQLVDFLYNLGAGTNSLIRVKSLTIQPDGSHSRLSSRVTVEASYQKKAVGAVGTTATATAQKRPAAEQKAAPAPTTAPAKPASKPVTNAAPVIKPAVAPNHGPTNRVVPPGITQPLTPNKK